MDPFKVLKAVRKASKTCPFTITQLNADEPKFKDVALAKKEGVLVEVSLQAVQTLLGIPVTAAASSPASSSSSSSSSLMRQTTSNSTNIDNGRGLQYIPGKHLGSGNFGDVYQCTDFFGQQFVLKVLKTNRGRQEVEADWKKEVAFLSSLRHPNIVMLYDSFQYNGFFNLILERCEGSLRDLRASCPDLTDNQVMDITGQLLSGLQHIHSMNIVHRDLQCDNILYRRERNYDSGKARFSAKISDFGISALMAKGQDKAVTSIGRDYDYAPELVTQGATTFRSDIYQVGLIIFFLITGGPALSAHQDGPSHQAVISGNAKKRALAIGTALGNGIAMWLELDPNLRPQTCSAAWKLIYREVYGGGNK